MNDSNLGLENIGDLSALLQDSSEEVKLTPIMIALDLIDEDPNQPRTESNEGFSKESLEELSKTIKERGVKSPISIRSGDDGRYTINHGARRYRASKLAGKNEIPSFLDNDYISSDQVVENLQRHDLTPLEMANSIQRELLKGKKKGQVAKEFGKSGAFITQHLALLKLPDSIQKVFNNGRVNDVTVINELVTAYKENPEEVNIWLKDDTQDLTRNSVKLLREFIDDKIIDENEKIEYKTDPEKEKSIKDTKEEKKESKKAAPDKFKKAIVLVIHNERTARIMLDKRPSTEGFGWLKYEDDGFEFEISFNEIKLHSILEG